MGRRSTFGGGPTHASDIVYWLGTYRYNTDRLWTESDKHLSEKTQSTLIAFAQTGNPDTSTVPGNSTG